MHLKGKIRLLFLVLIPLVLGSLYCIFNYNRFNFKGKVGLITLGVTKEEQVQLIKKKIEQFYGFSVRILPESPLPKEAYYPLRNRYKADSLLKYLSKIKSDEEDKIIALVQTDISVKSGEHKDWVGYYGISKVGWSLLCDVYFSTRFG